MTRGLWAYPWDLDDEGVERALDCMEKSVAPDSIVVAAAYHAGKFFLPHDPIRRVYFPEDGAVYFEPSARRWGGARIQPRTSQLARRRIIERTQREAHKRGLQVGAWMVCLHNTWQGYQHPELTARNAFGDSLVFQLCPNHDDVMAYVANLVGSLADLPERIERVQLEATGFLGLTHGYHHETCGVELQPVTEFLLGVCFCDACRRRAAEQGIEAEALRDDVRERIEASLRGATGWPQDALLSPEHLCEAVRLPEFLTYLRMRQDTVKRVVETAMRHAPPSASVEIITRPEPLAWRSGAHLRELLNVAQKLVVCLYHREAAQVERELVETVQLVEDAPRLVAALRLIAPDYVNGPNLWSKIRVAESLGVDGVMLYNYGLASMSALETVAQCPPCGPSAR